MRIRRRLPIIVGVLLVVAAVTLVVQLRKHAPPEPARLLPDGDGFVYVSLKWIRRANLSGQLPAVSHDPEYDRFIQATGFVFERDLDQAAFAVHYPVPTPGKTTDPSQPSRFSEVFIGRFNGEKLRAYLHQISSSAESYGPTDIYSIPLEGRTVRVAILGVDTVAASNHDDPQLIRGIIDRSRKLASPFGGPTLLREYYKHVPLASLAWTVFKVDPANNQPPPGPLGLSFLFRRAAVVVASARYLGAVRIRAEAFTGSEEDAQRLAEELNTFFNLFHSAENTVSLQGTDADVKKLFDSLKVVQNHNRAVLTATVPSGFIRKTVEEPPKELGPKPPQESKPAPVPPGTVKPK